jgi:hypothetical protein
VERERAGPATGVLAGAVGALVMVVLGLLAVGVQVSVQPDGLPRPAVVPPGTGGDDAVVALRVATVFGRPAAGIGSAGRMTSAADADTAQVAARMADELLEQAAATASHSGATAVPQAFPLAATALLWVGGAAAGAILLARYRGRRHVRRSSAVAAVVTVAVLAPVVVLWFTAIWGGSTAWAPAAIGHVALAAAGFTALQVAVLLWTGFTGLPALGLLYLVAAPLATRPLDLLVPVRRMLLWFGHPSPFAVEAWSMPLVSSPQQPLAGCVVLGGFLVIGLAVILWPRRAGASG